MGGKKLKSSVNARDNIMDFLIRMETFLQNAEAPSELQIRLRLEKLEAKWDEFEEIQSEIEGTEEFEENIDQHRQVRADFEDKYFEVRAGLEGKLPREVPQNIGQNIAQSAAPGQNDNVHSYIRLPQINLPEFDGHFENWLAFHDTFKALIDSSPELTNIQRFHYLRASLKGDALKLVDSFPMSEANYRIAWDSLVARFSNKYLLMKRHLNALFEYPKMRKETATGIHELIDCFERNTNILDQLGERTSGWGAMLTHLMVSKLDDTSQKRWEEHASGVEEPSFAVLIEFLKKQSRVLDAVSVDQLFSTAGGSSSSNFFKSRPMKVSVNSTTENFLPTCMVCNEQHFISRCPSFSELPLEERLQFTNSKHLCSNCLGRNHLARDCPSKYRCRTCSKKHHSLLHPGFPGSGSTSSTSTADLAVLAVTPSTSGGTPDSGNPDSCSISSISSNVAIGVHDSHVFLLTVMLKVKDRWGRNHLARAILDSGSQANLMTEHLCQLLKLQRSDRKVEISGIGRSRKQIAHEVSTVISSRIQDYSQPMNFLVMAQVTDDQPASSLSIPNWKPFPDMELADPEFFHSGPIDIVLGSQFFYDFHLLHGGRLQIRKFDNMLPVFVNTVFGWVAAGESECNERTSSVSCHLAVVDSLDKSIERFWNIEELIDKKPRSLEEEDCETHFRETVTRDNTGRYVVRYPKRMDFDKLIGESKSTAVRRFHQLERRLGRDADIRKRYNDFMLEYIVLGHMKLIGAIENIKDHERTVCYLPHHPVFKESSTTTKLRVVFDGSAKTSTNHSLNDALLTGPVIQDDLLDLMLRFRKHPIALVADVEKMYRQIRLNPEDTSLQRVIWRFDPSDPIEVYELQTVTYGLSPSSFLATRVIQKLAEDIGNQYELAAPKLSKDFYMDDFISGAESVDQARQLRKDAQALMAEGGLHLRKWNSNRPEVLDDTTIESNGSVPTMHFEPEQKIKTLGVVWEIESDQFGMEVLILKIDEQWTKRKVFSAIAQLYDPLGLVSPVTAWAKIRMQHLWLIAADWDDVIPEDICIKWQEFYEQLPLLQSFKVPRYVFVPDAVEVQFHIFSDASEMAYGACIYARSTSKDGKINTELISAKSRVAPLKRISLPRLELCAALLGAKLYARIAAALEMEEVRCCFWSDSTVVLHWIQAPSNSWQTFVGNRTSEIQRLTHGHLWKHVKGIDNPADYISRGMLPQNFIENTVWRAGPVWLCQREENWPEQPMLQSISEDLLERRKTVLLTKEASPDISLFERYSTFWKLVRITAIVLRFISRCRTKTPHQTPYLTVSELQAAKETLVKTVQYQNFPEEVKTLKRKGTVPSKSPLKNLQLFVDQKGILRLGGRLRLSEEKYQTKHPMVLPSKHPLTKLIAEHFHIALLHSGPRMTMATMRQEFWPLRAKDLVNSVCRKCHKCFRNRPAPITQPIGQLPKTRIAPSKPFNITGVDYCGPVYMKPVHRRAAPQKAFIAVFVCFTTKAVHLELVCDLSTDAFIAALRRFIARRGLPSEIHSDNGTNFQGAKNAMAAWYTLLNDPHQKQKIHDECSRRTIKWNFIPPRAPNFGGLWEAAVKTTKSTLSKILGNVRLSYEDYATVLAQVEANMNTRPLTPLSEDADELDVLTPGHFLTGSSFAALPDPDYSNVPTGRLKHYQQLQQLIQQHWIRWRKEYLTELNIQRKKSSSPVEIFVGQLVLVREDNKSSATWPLARILSIHPGEDQITRVVTLKTATGTYTRAVSKICPLPFDENLMQPTTNENSIQ
ncbi:uncharacterized protein LOC134207338 [Armigeres subalbatus]|uniref:uncharacterized protein LOC134207338 n=1 Tax=Armigeres subalbatus TaxID=124917 RepID=UPI002ED44858